MRARCASNTQVPGMSSYSSGRLLMVLGNESFQLECLSALRGFRLERVAGLDAFIQQRVRHAFREAPFGEDLGRLLERARFPVGADDIGVEVVFGGTAGRIVEVPEVARRDRVAARAE